MKFFYRISDKSYVKNKFPGITKKMCLKNFIFCFDWTFAHQANTRGSQTTIIADNCNFDTVDMCREFCPNIVETNLGNAGSLIHAIKLALELPDDEIVYFIEDDYLHRENNILTRSIDYDLDLRKVLEEGLEIADYVTLYDHPDKYAEEYNFGEITKVLRTKLIHWKYTISTTMTFATKVGTLRKDLAVWEKYTAGDHPHDHEIFLELGVNRKLAVTIPGLAYHTDLTYPEKAMRIQLDKWLLDLVTHNISGEITEKMQHEEMLDFFDNYQDELDKAKRASDSPILQMMAATLFVEKTKKAMS